MSSIDALMKRAQEKEYISKTKEQMEQQRKQKMLDSLTEIQDTRDYTKEITKRETKEILNMVDEYVSNLDSMKWEMKCNSHASCLAERYTYSHIISEDIEIRCDSFCRNNGRQAYVYIKERESDDSYGDTELYTISRGSELYDKLVNHYHLYEERKKLSRIKRDKERLQNTLSKPKQNFSTFRTLYKKLLKKRK